MVVPTARMETEHVKGCQDAFSRQFGLIAHQDGLSDLFARLSTTVESIDVGMTAVSVAESKDIAV